MRRPSHILYDLGNTLLFFDGAWEDVFHRALAAAGAEAERRDLVRSGEGLAAAFQAHLEHYYRQREVDLLEGGSLEVLREVIARESGPVPRDTVEAVLEAFYGVTQAHWQPVDQVQGTLAALRSAGFRQAVLSNASHDPDVQALVDKAGLRAELDFVLTSAALGRRKPDPFVFRAALDRWGAAPEEVLMVGDTPEADILGAQRAGLRSVWVRQYAGQEDPGRYRPDFQIDRLLQLPPLLDSLD